MRSGTSTNLYYRLLFLALTLCLALPFPAQAQTTHKVYCKGTDLELDVYTIRGRLPGPTLLLLGGIQGDEPGGYLAADLYADISLKKGNMIVVPRANLVSIVENKRGVRGDMNRKFARTREARDRDTRVVAIIKELMKQSDFFLNLHDGSGFYFPEWKSPMRNPLRFGQSIIADAQRYARRDGKVIELGNIARRVIARVNPQISVAEHIFRFNNHESQKKHSRHKEQRLSATFHALTKVGIPAFGIETSKSIRDFSLRVRYQTMIINAFLEECGIIPDNPRIFLEHPYLKYLLVSLNGRTPIVVNTSDRIEVRKGDRVRIVHTESNYSRGLTARIVGSGEAFNHMNQEVTITENTRIEVRKDRFLIAKIPVKIIRGRSGSKASGVHIEPRVRYFCVRVNDKTFVVEPGEELLVTGGDALSILDPKTNLDAEQEKAMRVDLRGFQAVSSPYPVEDRGHIIDTAKELRPKHARPRGDLMIYSLEAKLNRKVFGRSYIAVAEPRLKYIVFRGPNVAGFVAGPGDKLEIPGGTLVRIDDIRTNLSESTPLFVTMSGKTVRWRKDGETGIDASKLTDRETPLDITRGGKSMGRIWVKRGTSFRVFSGGNRSQPDQAVRVKFK